MSWIKLAIAAVVLIGFEIWATWSIITADEEFEEAYVSYEQYVHDCLHSD